MEVGSLFDGIGGWPLAATKYGINPVWAAEIESFPIEVTKKHFPNMKHLGDITAINGAEIEPVDIVCMGSPCQDLSIAGKREGLSGSRSGLFMDAVRIIREMREITNGKYPRFVVWENVPGAFSSNKGNDFRAVLEEITQSSIPVPQSGRWAKSGMVRSKDCEVAWRTLDAQYWGVPQRRKRIFLVADFGGQCAGEILFKPESVCRHTAESGSKGQRIAGNTQNSIGESVQCLTPWDVQSRRIFDAKGKWPAIYGGEGGGKGYVIICLNDQGGQSINVNHNVSPTMRSESHGNIESSIGAASILPFDTTQITSPQNGCKPKYGDPCHPLCATAHVPAIVVSLVPVTKEPVTFSVGNLVRGADAAPDNSGVCKTLRADMGDQHPCICLNDQGGQSIAGSTQNSIGTTECYPLNTQVITRHKSLGRGTGFGAGENGDPAYTLQAGHSHAVCAVDCRNLNEGHISGTLQAKGNGGYSLNYINPVRVAYVVRRLTPTECERLQGVPDGHTAGGSDTARYKALGNGMAQPCADFVMQGIAEVLNKKKM